MATAYASLVSLTNVLNRIQLHQCHFLFDQQIIQALFDKSHFLLGFLEDCNTRESQEMDCLVRLIIDAAYSIEDIIESYIVEQIHANSDKGHDCFVHDLQKVIQELDFIREEVIKINESKCQEGKLFSCSVSVGSLGLSSDKNITVGLEEDLIRLMDQVTSQQSSRQIIPIVGMGGIGKTTLARNVYEHPFVTNHFHVRMWVTISQDYNTAEILLYLLRGINVVVDGSGKSIEQLGEQLYVDRAGKSIERLGEQLYKGLFGRKYLVVLDDIWSDVAWEEIRRFFPENNNGSRILLTTRLSSVALAVGSRCPYEVELLDTDKSWELFSRLVFGEEVCPAELEKIGEQIANSCKGLPLALVVIGGLLKMSQKTRQYWEDVSENVKNIINTKDDEHCLRILSLSYNHLPIHLKPCFLYMAMFPEDKEICVTRLMRLWVSDGFLKPITGKTLEVAAVEYLNDLIGRNLIMVGKRAKRCILHDLVRDLCLREAEKERFFCLLKEDTLTHLERIKTERRFVMNSSMRTESVIPLPSTARSVISDFQFPLPPTTSSGSLLRVIHMSGPCKSTDILQLVNSRYLELSVEWYVQTQYFSSVYLLWNLETLVVRGISWVNEVTLPSGIWGLQHLRHLIFSERVFLPEPLSEHSVFPLDNLQTLSRIEDFSYSEDVASRMPNLAKLSIFYDMNKASQDLKLASCFNYLVDFHKLETLKCAFTPKQNDNLGGVSYKCVFNDLERLSLPASLRKLSLWGSNIPWKYMSNLGSLPKLEVLKLENDAFCGMDWFSTEGGFQCLKYLLIDSCDLATWEAESSHFPRLEHLEFCRLKNMEEIPCGVVEIMPLKLIRLYFCETPLIMSTMELLEEQQIQGNDDLQIEVHIPKYSELESLAVDNSHFRIIIH